MNSRRGKSKKRGKGESKTSARRTQASAKQLKALELRIAGVSLERIARAVGYKDASGAYRAIMAAMDKTLQEPAQELRKMELERLDKMLFGLWPEAKKGNTYAVDKVLSIMQRRARLLGLDAPVKTEHSGTLEIEGALQVEHDYDQLRKLLRDKEFRALASRVVPEVGA